MSSLQADWPHLKHMGLCSLCKKAQHTSPYDCPNPTLLQKVKTCKKICWVLFGWLQCWWNAPQLILYIFNMSWGSNIQHHITVRWETLRYPLGTCEECLWMPALHTCLLALFWTLAPMFKWKMLCGTSHNMFLEIEEHVFAYVSLWIEYVFQLCQWKSVSSLVWLIK